MLAASSDVTVRIHPSQFPGAVAAAMHASLNARRMNHKFHYDTARQTLRWLRVHQAYSPACTDPAGTALYSEAAAAAAVLLRDRDAVDVVSLGSGGGQKDAHVLSALEAIHPGVRRRYVPVDVSAGLALISRDAAMAVGTGANDIVPYVMDLAESPDWLAALAPVLQPQAARLILFYGMLPNFIPGTTRDRLAALLRRGDLLLVSANLAPGPDYAAGVESIRPLYDNALTSEWLLAVLQDLGADREDARIQFSVVPCPDGSGLLRIEACAHFLRPTRLAYEDAVHTFEPGEKFQLFFSYRHTPERVAGQLASAGLQVEQEWLNPAGDEGVFLITQKPRNPAGTPVS
jgi:uncharacterized SAM-dependent methyltransferase